jgi:AraC-like DNA-binding protein
MSVRWAVKAHCHAHGGAAPACKFRAEAEMYHAWHVRGGIPRSSKTAFKESVVLYFRALHRTHPTPVNEAARWIVKHSRERLNVRVIARAAGVHPVTLRRGFKASFGLALHSYVQRTRLADTMRLLVDGSHDVRSALYSAGWSSPKSLYHAAFEVTGISVHELRALPRDEWERRVALPQPL